jgi:hypothetical protein
MDLDLKNIQINLGDLGAYRFEKSLGAEFYENIQNGVNLNNNIIGMLKDLMKTYTTLDYTGLGFSLNNDKN